MPLRVTLFSCASFFAIWTKGLKSNRLPLVKYSSLVFVIWTQSRVKVVPMDNKNGRESIIVFTATHMYKYRLILEFD